MAFVAGRLYVSTKRTGLLVYDPAAGSWRQIGPDQGLMDWNVCHINAIDDTTLLVVSSDGDRRIVYGTLDVTTGKTTLLHHHLETPMGGARYPVMAPTCTWPTGKQWIAMNYTGLARDILRKQPEFERWPDVWPHGWKCRPFTRSCEPTSIATVGKRRYVMAGTGLHEIDANADVIRTWANRMSFSAGGPDRDNLARDDITTPADFPVDDLRTCYSYLSASEDRLFLFAENGAVLCYEPESDTWLGPLSLPESYDGISALGDNNGVWVGGASHLSYVRAADFAAAARAAGRTMTSADVRRHKREHAEKAGGLEAARFDLLMRNFDSAKERTQAVLDADPANTQALLTMAVLHDFWCLNRPEEAMKWYGRLAKLQDDKSAVFTGLYGVFRITYTLDRYDQAIAAGNRLLDEVPCMYAHMRHTVERFMTYARRNMAKAQPVD
jgi:hypothetical protein